MPKSQKTPPPPYLLPPFDAGDLRTRSLALIRHLILRMKRGEVPGIVGGSLTPAPFDDDFFDDDFFDLTTEVREGIGQFGLAHLRPDHKDRVPHCPPHDVSLFRRLTLLWKQDEEVGSRQRAVGAMRMPYFFDIVTRSYPESDLRGVGRMSGEAEAWFAAMTADPVPDPEELFRAAFPESRSDSFPEGFFDEIIPAAPLAGEELTDPMNYGGIPATTRPRGAAPSAEESGERDSFAWVGKDEIQTVEGVDVHEASIRWVMHDVYLGEALRELGTSWWEVEVAAAAAFRRALPAFYRAEVERLSPGLPDVLWLLAWRHDLERFWFLLHRGKGQQILNHADALTAILRGTPAAPQFARALEEMKEFARASEPLRRAAEEFAAVKGHSRTGESGESINNEVSVKAMMQPFLQRSFPIRDAVCSAIAGTLWKRVARMTPWDKTRFDFVEDIRAASDQGKPSAQLYRLIADILFHCPLIEGSRIQKRYVDNSRPVSGETNQGAQPGERPARSPLPPSSAQTRNWNAVKSALRDFEWRAAPKR